MSNRNREFKPDYVVAGDLAADFRSPWLNVEGVDNLSFQLAWTGTPTSVIIIEASNDGPAVDASTRQEQPSGQVGATTIATVATGNPAGADGNLIVPLTDRAERWVRVFIDRTSGTGAVNIAFAGKGK